MVKNFTLNDMTIKMRLNKWKELFTVCLILVFTTSAYGQRVENSFGLDADPWNDTFVVTAGLGGIPKQGSNDWFPKPYRRPGDSGYWAIDTTGAYKIKQDHIGGVYYPFNRGMSVAPYEIVDSFRFIWAAYLRDEVNSDNSIFTGGDKNADNPLTTWGVTSGSIPDKNDLVDGAVFVMRSGLKTTSHLYLYGLAGIYANNGDRNIDYEMFRTKASVSGSSFINTGDDDGHSSWRFFPNGNLKEYGDILVSIEGSGTSVNLISLRIWMQKSTYDSMRAGTFPLPPGLSLSANFEVGTSGAYGYAEVNYTAAPPGQTFFFGRTSSTLGANTPSPPWGTFGKSGGTSGYRQNDYFTGQFLEFGLDLTYMGIDPYQFKTVDTGDWCNPSFGSVMMKSRSSSSFSSALKDFIGPASFVLPPISVKAKALSGLTCVSTSACTKVTNDTGNNKNNWYEWVKEPSTSSIDTGKYFCTGTPGTYKVYAMRGEGCRRVDSATIVITVDRRQPVAYATARDTLIDGSVYVVNIKGDSSQIFTNIVMAIDSAQFGPSKGLTYSWQGTDPWNNTMNSTLANPPTSDTGWYRLVVTEPRNGCKDTAIARVAWLPIVWGNFSCSAGENNSVLLNWSTLEEQSVESFEIQRFNLNHFETIGSVKATGNAISTQFYQFKDVNPKTGRNFYRIKSIASNGSFSYSEYCETTLRGADVLNSLPTLNLYPNPTNGEFMVSVTGAPAENSILSLFDASGKLINSTTLTSNVSILNISKLAAGIYVVKIEGSEISEIQKIIKK